jgi:translation initiation factor IF-3
MFRGREMAHPERGRDLLMRLAEDVSELGHVESQPVLDTPRNMVMVLAPTKNAGVKRDAQDENVEQREEAVQGDGERPVAAAARHEEPQPGEEVVQT